MLVKQCRKPAIFWFIQPIKMVPSSKLTVRPWQIGVGRLVSTKKYLFSESIVIVIYWRAYHHSSPLIIIMIINHIITSLAIINHSFNHYIL